MCNKNHYLGSTPELKAKKDPEHYNDAFCKSADRACKRYPELPYHHPGHMKDVMQAVSELVELLPGDGYQRVIDPWQESLLVLAAAWHDAGFDEKAAQEYPTKEEYASALLLTIMTGPPQRDTPEAKLLHHADMAYMTADWKTFWRGAEAFHHEEHPDMSWEKFQKFEAKFFPIYMESLKNDFQSLGIAEDEIEKRLKILKSHLDQVTAMDNPWTKRQNHQ